MRHSNNWPECDVYLLWSCMVQGLHASEAGRKLDRSRNQIIGKAFRLWGGWGRIYAPKREEFNVKKPPYYAAVVDNEAICISEIKREAIDKAYFILQMDNPEGEEDWDKKEVEGMVKKVSHRKIAYLKLE